MDCLPGFQLNETLRNSARTMGSELVIGAPLTSPYSHTQQFRHNPATNFISTTYIKKNRSRSKLRELVTDKDQILYRAVILTAQSRTEADWRKEFGRALFPEELNLMHHVLGGALRKTMRHLGIWDITSRKRITIQQRVTRNFLRKVFLV